MNRYLEQGWTADRIAAETGSSGQYVRDRLRDHQIPLRRPGEGPPGRRADHTQVLAWVEQGMSVAEVARRSGYTPSGVYVLLRRHGLPTPGSAPRPESVDPTEIGDLYRQGLTLKAIGARYGHGPDWARARVLAAGVELRGPSRRPSLDTAAVRRGLDEGLTVMEIAQRLGYVDDAVRRRIVAQGWPLPARRPRSRVLPPLPIDVVRRLYVQEGKSLAETAAALGVSNYRVVVALDDAGIARRAALSRRRADPDPEAVRRLYVQERLTVSAIARQLGCPRWRVDRVLAEHGITRPSLSFDVDAATLRELYVEQRLDDIAIGHRFDVPPFQVRVRREQLGIRRPAATPPHPPPVAMPPAEQLRRWYHEEHRTLAMIARDCHTSVRTVRAWMRQAGITVKARTTRSQRRKLDPHALREMYIVYQWSAREIATELGRATTTNLVLRALHAHGIPVRTTRRRLDSCRLLDLLYDDESVLRMLDHHNIPVRNQPGSIADRFPIPAPLTRPLLNQAYLEIGLSARLIELLTGQPSDQILDALHSHGIPVRTRDGMSPWLSGILSDL